MLLFLKNHLNDRTRTKRVYFSIEYPPDAKMVHTDSLSERSLEDGVSSKNIEVMVSNVTEDHWILSAQLQNNGQPSTKQGNKDIHRKFCLKDQGLYRLTADNLK